MKILRVRAHDFGKLNGELDLAPGMTVVHGENEAGKSTWLQAIFAGLCGRRRGRGANTLEDRKFERQYAPWNGEPWRVTVKLQLDDGRRVEIQQQDLEAKKGVAQDADTGRPIGDEIIYRGSVDGSRFLGLNRQVMPSTLVIAQGDIQRLRQKSEKKGDEASVLKQALQRAAASAGGAKTAAQALIALKDYASTEIGLERKNSTKPLQRAIERAARADGALEAARGRQRERDRLERDLASAQEQANRATAWADGCEGLLTRRELDRLDRRIAEIEQLERTFPDGPPEGSAEHEARTGGAESAAAAIERQLRDALFEYRRRPEAAPDLDGPSAEDMAKELAELPEAPTGDREIASEVAAAAQKWREVREARNVRERLGPGDAPDTAIGKEDEGRVQRALAALETPPPEPLDELERRIAEMREPGESYTKELEANSGYGKWPWRGAFVGGLVGFLALFFPEDGTMDWAPRAIGVVAFLLALVCGLLIHRAKRRTPQPDRVSPGELVQEGMDLADAEADLRDLKRKHKAHQRQLESAHRELESFGLEADADAAREALRALQQRETWDREHATWQRRMANAREDEAAAEKALREALEERGAADPEAPTAALFDEYEQLCRRNSQLAAGTDRREALAAQVEARQRMEQAAARQREQRAAAEGRFRSALDAAGFGADSTEDPEAENPEVEDPEAENPEEWADRWLDAAERHRGERQRNWDRLQNLLEGRDRQGLAAERDNLAARLVSTARGRNHAGGAAASQAPDELQSMTIAELRQRFDEARTAAARAGKQASNLEGQLAADGASPALAELEEERTAAEREVRRLRRATDILDIATMHLKAAEAEVHRLLAPDLRAALEERLKLMTDGRYAAARIDPKDGLEVQVEVEDGSFRSASELSHGTVEQVYLLLRIGLAEALGDRKESAPLFLDDATVHSDAARTERFLALLLELGRERQIVFFTQEEEVRAWAQGRLAGDPRHRLIELDRDGRPRCGSGDDGSAEDEGGAGGFSLAPAPQHSLL